MYFIVVKFPVKPEWSGRWLDQVDGFGRAHPGRAGNLFFDGRAASGPNTFVLVEPFTDEGAGPHVNSDHFRQAMSTSGPGLLYAGPDAGRGQAGTGWTAGPSAGRAAPR